MADAMTREQRRKCMARIRARLTCTALALNRVTRG
jgi:hypothetical protein